MPDCHIDIESFSRCDLKRSGLAKYAEDESTCILCIGYSFDEGPVHVWVPDADEQFAADNVDGVVHRGNTVPNDLCLHIESGGKLLAYNAAFERCVLNGPAGRQYSFPHIEIPQTQCVMAQSRIAGLPGSLEDSANALDVAHKKQMTGQNALRYLCKPRKDGTRPLMSEERERFIEVVNYNADDVRAERDVHLAAPKMTAAAQAIWEIDQEMNDNGWTADLAAVDDMEVLVAAYKKELEAKCRTLTGIKPSRPGPLADWIRQHGFLELENLQADTVRKALMKEIPEDIKTVLKIYSTFNMKAVAKYPAIRNAVCKDGRLRHLFMFYGAGTGRWSSVIVQLQNLFRPVIDDPEVAIEAARDWDLDWIRSLYPGTDPMKVLASCVRSVLTAGPKKQLVFPDYAGVEARWNAWMFNEQWKLEAYHKFDQGVGPNLYCVVYGQCFGVDPRSPEAAAGKQQGKVLDLSMGYEGGVGAFVKMAGTYRIDLRHMAESTYPTLPRDIVEESIEAHRYATEQGRLYDLPEKIWITAEGLKRLWRRAHPRIVAGWRELKDAAINAVENPGVVYKIPNGRVMFKVEGRWLVMRLPSGRRLWYYKPTVREAKKVSGQNGTGTGGYVSRSKTLYYFGVNTQTRQWGMTSTYGGKTCENETQGGCADLLIRSKHKLRAAGLPLIGSIHDQPVMEVDAAYAEYDEIERLMCTGQTWDEGLPLAVEMHHGFRFRK